MSSATLQSPVVDDRLDRIFHALADRTRRALLAMVSREPQKITELAKPFDMSFPAVSKHLRVLEGAGLIRRAVDGRVHRCSFDATPLKEADVWLETYRTFWTESLDALAQYAEKDR